MEFDLPTTTGLLALVVALGTAVLIAAGVMGTRTVLLMVTPAMLVFGLISLALGVKHGEYRTR